MDAEDGTTTSPAPEQDTPSVVQLTREMSLETALLSDRYANLTELHLTNRSLTTLPDAIDTLSHITLLNVSENPYETHRTLGFQGVLRFDGLDGHDPGVTNAGFRRSQPP
jgi:hypothetical protein